MDEILRNTRLLSLDSDIPNFTPTKYKKLPWRIWHCLTYFIFSVSTCSFIFDFSVWSCSVYIVGASCFLLSSFTEYLHYQRGCIGMSNLNSYLKTNRKKNCITILKRSENGVYYFLSVISSLMLLIESILFFFAYYPHKKDTKWKPKLFYSQFALVCLMIMFIAQLLKLGKITLPTFQYHYKQDMSNVVKEFLWLLASLFYIIGLIWNLVTTTLSYSPTLPNVSQYSFICGAVCFFLSASSLIFRYFLSGYDDLNMEGMSFVTV